MGKNPCAELLTASLMITFQDESSLEGPRGWRPVLFARCAQRLSFGSKNERFVDFSGLGCGSGHHFVNLSFLLLGSAVIPFAQTVCSGFPSLWGPGVPTKQQREPERNLLDQIVSRCTCAGSRSPRSGLTFSRGPEDRWGGVQCLQLASTESLN